MLKLRTDPDPILKQRAEPFNFESVSEEYTARLESDMLELMTASNGIGLAANQVGLLNRVFVIQLSDGQRIAMFNPRVLSESTDIQDSEEGCLSFPDLWLDVKRPKTIEAAYLDKTGKECILTLTGIDARCFLHELDHLDGITFTTKVSQMKLLLAQKKQLKRQRIKNG